VIRPRILYVRLPEDLSNMLRARAAETGAAEAVVVRRLLRQLLASGRTN